MKILALDYSTTACGFCIGTESGHIISSGVIIPRKNAQAPERIQEIAERMRAIIGKSDVKIFIEDTYISANVKTTLIVQRGAGYLLGYLRVSMDHVTFISPNEWRKRVYHKPPRNRKLLKQLAIEEASRRTNRKVQSDDEAEAIMIYIASLKKSRPEKNRNPKKDPLPKLRPPK